MGRGVTGRPNILLVVFDSLSAHDLALHLDDLPTLSRLSSEGRSFTNVYTCCPESSPSRASLLTGLDIGVHALWTDGVTLGKRETTVSEAFAAQGYRTWLVGRRQLAGVSNWTTEHARRREYHAFDWSHGPLHRSRQNAYLVWLQQSASDQYAAIFPRQADPDDTAISDEQRLAMMALPDALSFNAWVAQRAGVHMGDQPLFGIAGFVVGQTMGAAAAPVETLNPHSLRQADVALAMMLDGLPDNTIVVVTAGRGSVPDANTTDFLQERAINVPLILYSKAARPEVMHETVSTIDIAPTLYDLAGIHPPQRVQGVSLNSGPLRGWALSRMRNDKAAQQTALRTDHWKLIVTHGDADATCLYDLGVDPAEARNLANTQEHQGRLEAMMDLMIDARVALEDRLERRVAKF